MSGYLVLESGEIYEGVWQGGKDRAGEVVFNTSHSGYEEIATDPSYFSQIVVLTAPMQGNYGADKSCWESQRIWIEGFVCLQIQNSSRDSSWRSRLIESGIPLVSELDTRSLVLRLRQGGTPWGALVQAATRDQAVIKAQSLITEKKKMEKDWVWLVSRKVKETRPGENIAGPRLAVLDFGSKENILRELSRYTRELHVFPSRSSLQEIMNVQPDAVMLTNGPGDPADVQVAIQTVKELVGQIPIFGICMGHQILALAVGAKTYKLKFGHRGSNHPIKDALLQKTYVSSQNHGYAVEEKSLPLDARVTHKNLNDGTVAGFYNEKKNYLGIQYHPEACPGPHEAQELFSFFIHKMVNRGMQ